MEDILGEDRLKNLSFVATKSHTSLTRDSWFALALPPSEWKCPTSYNDSSSPSSDLGIVSVSTGLQYSESRPASRTIYAPSRLFPPPSFEARWYSVNQVYGSYISVVHPRHLVMVAGEFPLQKPDNLQKQSEPPTLDSVSIVLTNM